MNYVYVDVPITVIPRNPKSADFPQNYACCGRFHVQSAATFCVFLVGFCQVIQMIVNHIHGQVFTSLSPEVTVAADILELSTAALVIYAIYKKDDRLLLPAVFFNLVLITALLLHTIVLARSEITGAKYDDIENPGLNLFRILYFVYYLVFQVWFTSILLALYAYIHSRRTRNMTLYPHIIVNPNYEEN